MPAACPDCGGEMRRIFTAPKLLGRQKPGSFRHDKGKLNGWDDRLQHMRTLEDSRKSDSKQKLREFETAIGPQLAGAIKTYKRERYG